MRPKGIRKPCLGAYRPSLGFSGIAIDIVSTITTSKIVISESVVVNDPTTHQTNTIAEVVGVVVTP